MKYIIMFLFLVKKNNLSALKFLFFLVKKYFVERIHNMMTDFICKMPEKIKDLKRRNEESKNLEEMGQHGAGNLSFHSDLQASIFSGNLSSYAANQSQARLAMIANHDFEEFLNLVIKKKPI